MSDVDSAGVYFMSVEEFEARADAAPTPPRGPRRLAAAVRRWLRRLLASASPPPPARPGDA